MNNIKSALKQLNLLNRPTNVIEVVSKQTGLSQQEVSTVLNVANQFVDLRFNQMQELQEDMLNLITKVQKETEQYGNKQKITNLHLNEIKKAMDNKAEKVINKDYQLDFEDIFLNARTTDEIYNANITQSKNKRAYAKEKRDIKNAIWRLIKMHLNDLYGTPKTQPQRDYQDYMYSDIQQYIKDLSVTTIRKYMSK